MPEITPLNESRGRGFFIESEANGNRSRETEVLIAGQVLAVGAVVGTITGSGKMTEVDLLAGDGSEVVSGMMIDKADAALGDKEVAILARDAEVHADEVVYPAGATQPDIDAINLALEALGIIVRTA